MLRMGLVIWRQTKYKLAAQRHAAKVGRRVRVELKQIERQIVDAGLMPDEWLKHQTKRMVELDSFVIQISSKVALPASSKSNLTRPTVGFQEKLTLPTKYVVGQAEGQCWQIRDDNQE